MAEKLAYYDRFGVEEYYVYDPPPNTLEVWLRQDGRLKRMSHLKGWTSPRLGIRFALGGKTLEIFDPQGQPFLTSVERDGQLRREQARADDEHRRAEREVARADEERTRADRVEALAAAASVRAEQERARAERLAERLRELGIEP